MKRLPWFVLTLVVACSGGAPPQFDARRVIEHVERQVAYGPRIPGTAARDSAAAYISRVLTDYGALVNAQAFVIPDPWSDNSLKLINLIASFEPERPNRILLASHYDSRPWADMDTTEALRAQPVPGAIDGATSTGLLLEIARVISRRMPDDIGVDLVFFDGEDLGVPDSLQHYLQGSRYFAGNMGGYFPRYAIVVDMIGGKGTQIAREANSAHYSPVLVDTLFARAKKLKLTSFVDVLGPAIFDDHIPLIQAGVTAVDLFGYDYAAWHTTRDTPDQCDPVLIDEVARLLLDFLYDYPF